MQVPLAQYKVTDSYDPQKRQISTCLWKVSILQYYIYSTSIYLLFPPIQKNQNYRHYIVVPFLTGFAKINI